jgi:hypothetical protein
MLAAAETAQDRVVSRQQLAAAGYNAQAVGRRIDAGDWQALGAAIVLHSGEISGRQHQWIAMLTAPGFAAISGRTATTQFGLRGFVPNSIDVLIPFSTKPAALVGVRWRRIRDFDSLAIAQRPGPATVTRERAVLDAASWTPDARVACALLAAAVQQRVTPIAMLRSQFSDDAVRRHHAIFGLILADIEGGADSLGEIDLGRLARKAGLPPPIRQSIRRDLAGRRRYLDADFGTFVVEVDGGLHLRAQTYWNDAHRQNELVLGGDRILRFPTIAIRLDEETVVRQLRRAKAIFG